jgi:long-subunit acyl-CoA synthetase (AMP-forming)
MTESCGNATHTVPADVWMGSSGSLLPAYEAKILSPDGREITEYDQPGELWLKSPCICQGYYRNSEANAEIFQGSWMRTGDEALVRVSSRGNEHFFIVDRIKELVKVKVGSPLRRQCLSVSFMASLIGPPDHELSGLG